MIIENNIIAEKQAQIAAIWEEIHTLHQQRESLEAELLQPAGWYENTAKRIIIDDGDAVRLTINAKALIDYLFSSDITAEKIGDKTYVYVNYILPEHESILILYGAEIENAPIEQTEIL
jgi:hypothetical protein